MVVSMHACVYASRFSSKVDWLDGRGPCLRMEGSLWVAMLRLED